MIVQPVGEGQGKLKQLPGAAAPQVLTPEAAGQQPAPAAVSAEWDLFKGFDFGQ